MIKSQIFEMTKSYELTKKDIEKFFKQKKINPIKWAVVRVMDDFVQILVSFF